jgi:hypothetical protein
MIDEYIFFVEQPLKCGCEVQVIESALEGDGFLLEQEGELVIAAVYEPTVVVVEVGGDFSEAPHIQGVDEHA